MSLTITILGCGSSGGVPRIGGEQGMQWGACDPDETKNNRKRCSILVEKIHGKKKTTVIVDTAPDLRAQMLENKITFLDAVLFSHEHADHVHGIDDLRPMVFAARRRINVWANTRTANILKSRFGYCFEKPDGSPYPPILDLNPITSDTPILIEGEGGIIEALPFDVPHGNINALGFRFNKAVYTPDLNGLFDTSHQYLHDLDIWIIDALRYTPHPTHLNVEQACAYIEQFKPKKAILTNMHNDLDYQTLKNMLPSHIVPAYDGMRILVDETEKTER